MANSYPTDGILGTATDVCTGGKELQECASACPLTCANYASPPVECTQPCMEGCGCPLGKVELDGGCVEPSACAGISLCTVALHQARHYWSQNLFLP